MSNRWDYSNILLSNNAGARIGAGLEAAAGAVAKGIQGYRIKKKEKEDEQAAVDWLKGNAAKFGLPINAQDDGEIKAAVKAAGGGPQAIQMITGLMRQQQQAAAQAQALEVQKQQIELGKQQLAAGSFQLTQAQQAQQERLAQQGAMAAAAGGAPTGRQAGAMIEGGARFEDLRGTPGADPQAAVLDYLRRTGDAAGAAKLATTQATVADIQESQFTPAFGTGPGGRQYMTTSRRSAVPLTDPTMGKSAFHSTPGKLLEDADAREAAGDKAGADALRAIAAKGGQQKPMSLTDYLISGGQAEDYRAYVDGFTAQLTGQPAAAQAGDRATSQYQSAEEVRSAVRTGKLSRDEAAQILKSQFGYR